LEVIVLVEEVSLFRYGDVGGLANGIARRTEAPNQRTGDLEIAFVTSESNINPTRESYTATSITTAAVTVTVAVRRKSSTYTRVALIDGGARGARQERVHDVDAHPVVHGAGSNDRVVGE